MATTEARMRQLQATEAAWTAEDPTLLDGEIAFSSDIKRFRVGPGLWSSLPYWNLGAAPSDGFLYGQENGNWQEAVAQGTYSGSLNNVPAQHVGFVRLVQPITEGWDGATTGDNHHLLQMTLDGTDRIQVGYAWSDTAEAAAVIHTRVSRGGVWSDWLTSTQFLEDPYTDDADLLAISARSYSIQVMVGSGMTNGWTGAAVGDILLTYNRSSSAAVQVGYAVVGTENERTVWLRRKASDVWSDWARSKFYEEDIVNLDRIRWRGNWVDGNTYELNDAALDYPYLMIANKQTTDRPAPQEAGLPTFVYQGASPEGNLTAKSLLVGQDYVFPASGFLTNYRIYGKTGNEYTPYYRADGGAIVTLPSFTATSDGWVTFPTNSPLFVAGNVLTLAVYITPPNPAPTTFNGDWNYITPNNAANPTNGQIQHANKALDSFRISKTDNGGGNRGPELEALTVGDVIDGAGTRWTILDINDNGTWIEFVVSPGSQGAPDGVQDFIFETVASVPITTVIDPDYFVPNGNVAGWYTIDSGVREDTQDAYGVDIEVQEASVSDDWDLMALSGGGGSSGGDGGGGASTFDELSDTPASKSGAAGMAVAVNSGEDGLEYIQVAAGGPFLPLDGSAEMTGVFLPRQQVEAIRFVRTVNTWDMGAHDDGNYIRFRANGASAARLASTGTYMASTLTIVTREKGDARYEPLGGSDDGYARHWGSVASNGTLKLGSTGVSVAYVGAGTYDITIPAMATADYAVVVQTTIDITIQATVADNLSARTTTGFRVMTGSSATASISDIDFDFIVMGTPAPAAAQQPSTAVVMATASDYDQWEFDRQQNIIDTIDAETRAGVYSSDPLAEGTASVRRREAVAVQNYLVQKNIENDQVNEAVDAADEAWVAANPAPPPPPEHDDYEDDPVPPLTG